MIAARPTASFRDLALWITPLAPVLPEESPRFRYTYNGRSALYRLLKSLPAGSGDTILVPAFHCPAVVEPVVQSGYKLRFYGVMPDLRSPAPGFADSVSDDVAAVLVINYFGFEFDLDLIRRSLGPHRLVIEDCSHSFVNAATMQLMGTRAQAAIYSFYKTVPSFIGGGVRSNDERIRLAPLETGVPLRELARIVKNVFEESIVNMRPNPVRALYQRLEALRVRLKRAGVPDSRSTTVETAFEAAYPFSIEHTRYWPPWLVRRIMLAADLERIVAARRRNFRLVGELLRNVPGVEPVFGELAENVCPWAFPILIRDRSAVDFRLRDAGVPLFTFGDTLHPALRRDAPESTTAVRLSNELLCLSVSHNLSERQVADYCDKITRNPGLR